MAYRARAARNASRTARSVVSHRRGTSSGAHRILAHRKASRPSSGRASAMLTKRRPTARLGASRPVIRKTRRSVPVRSVPAPVRSPNFFQRHPKAIMGGSIMGGTAFAATRGTSGPGVTTNNPTGVYDMQGY